MHWRVGRRLGLCRLISAVFDRVNNKGKVLRKLCSIGIGSSVCYSNSFYQINHSVGRLNWLTLCQEYTSELLTTSKLFSILENKVISYAAYANESTLVPVVPSQVLE